jgi:hypothetical protein
MDKVKANLILINPKTRELIRCAFVKNRSVYLVSLLPEQRHLDEYQEISEDSEFTIGKGYLDERQEFEIGRETFARAHSPGGVKRRGSGDGFLLYAGLTLRAYNERRFQGIGSTRDSYGDYHSRSSSADAFWNRAVEIGFAQETDLEIVEESERTTEYEPRIDCDDIGDEDCADIVDVGTATVEYKAEDREEIEVQYIDADTMGEAGVVLWRDDRLQYEPDFEEIPEDVLLGLDLSTCNNLEAVQIVFERLSKTPPEYVEPLFYSLIPAVRSHLLKGGFYAPPVLANGKFRPFRRNSGLEAEIDKVWDSYYGALQDFP